MNPLMVGSSCAPNQLSSFSIWQLFHCCLIACLLCSCNHPCFAITICVDQNAIVNQKGSGKCWTDPYLDLEDALSYARQNSNVDTIWIASGVYRPSKTYSPIDSRGFESLAGAIAKPQYNPGITFHRQLLNYHEHKHQFNKRLKTFHLVDHVDLIGGFQGQSHPNGGETQLTQRLTSTPPTVLDGEIEHKFKVWHVLTAGNDLTYQGVNLTLDGMTIRNGDASHAPYYPIEFPLKDGQQPRHYHDDGGGLYVFTQSNIQLNRITFEHNQAISGGAIFVQDGSILHLNHCYFSNNKAIEGNAISARGGGPVTKAVAPKLTSINLFQTTFDQKSLNHSYLSAYDNYLAWSQHPRVRIEVKPN